jgi:hypothetical protein
MHSYPNAHGTPQGPLIKPGAGLLPAKTPITYGRRSTGDHWSHAANGKLYNDSSTSGNIRFDNQFAAIKFAVDNMQWAIFTGNHSFI